MPVAGFNRPGDGGGGLKLGDKLNFVNNLVAKSQPSTMADSVQTLINKVANLGYVGSKRWASGTVSSDASNYATVSGLTFTPSMIILMGTSTSLSDNQNMPIVLYNASKKWYDYAHLGANTAYDYFVLYISRGSTNGTNLVAGTTYVNNGGFKLNTQLASYQFNWYAFE